MNLIFQPIIFQLPVSFYKSGKENREKKGKRKMDGRVGKEK